jgi:hypothetical protein
MGGGGVKKFALVPDFETMTYKQITRKAYKDKRRAKARIARKSRRNNR